MLVDGEGSSTNRWGALYFHGLWRGGYLVVQDGNIGSSGPLAWRAPWSV